MVLVEFSIFPTDKGASVSKYVSKVLNYIDESGITYQLTPMGTVLEGEFDEVMNVVSGCYKILDKESDRIYMNLKMDARKGDSSRMKSKIEKIKSITKKDIQT